MKNKDVDAKMMPDGKESEVMSHKILFQSEMA